MSIFTSFAAIVVQFVGQYSERQHESYADIDKYSTTLHNKQTRHHCTYVMPLLLRLSSSMCPPST